MPAAGVSRIAVIIPAHNEEQFLPACLASLEAAATRTELPVRVVVAVDRCTDTTAELARSFGATTVTALAPGVGSARAAGCAAALADGPEGLWLATTDADSTVPIDWFGRQLAHARRGADVVIGTVAVEDWSEYPAHVPARYLDGYQFSSGHRHIHGANLGFRADCYLAIGGFTPVSADEDVELIGRFERAGHQLVWAGDLAVTTSARRIGRAPRGFASFLSALAEPVSTDWEAAG